MTHDRHQRVYELFDRAISLNATSRSDFLDCACANDPDLRREVEELIARSVRTDQLPVVPLLDHPTDMDSKTEDDPARIGRYPILGQLGSGGMGVVYLARDPELDREIALKTLPASFAQDAERIARFRREARMLAAVTHPNIAMIHTIEESEGSVFLTMERVAGTSLDDTLRSGAIPVSETLRIGRQITAAVEAAHRRGIIHRDLKPANAMVTPEGHVKVLDFGLARSIQGLDGLTVDGAVMGTPGYASPEQLRGEAIDVRTDIWAIGCILYECLTGNAPFRGPAVPDAYVATLEQEPDWDRLPPDVPPGVSDLIHGCLQKDAGQRVATMNEVRHGLDEELALASVPRNLVQRATDSATTNLPAPLSSFVGRETELGILTAMLDEHRLVTLTGAGGCGKTRLALEGCSRILDRFEHGIWMVDLAPSSDAQFVPQAVAAAFELKESVGRGVEDVVEDYLRAKEILLVLDNCEHVLDAIAPLAETWLRIGAGVRLLATSREALGITGETILVVPTLAVPDAAESATAEDVSRSEAVQLFVKRARAVCPGFDLTDDDASFVSEICRRLDGIPLALEMAAARMKVLTARDLAARLDARLNVLVGSGRTGLPHHRTLHGLIDWSYEHLDEKEKAVLRRLSVFAGGWTLTAAEAVCSDEVVERWEVLDLFTRLMDKSLVEHDPDKSLRCGQARYRMLETLREFTLTQLKEAGEETALRRRHQTYFVALAETAAPHLMGSDQLVWLARLDADYENLRLGFERNESDHDERRLRLVASLITYWDIRGYWSQGRALSAQALTGMRSVNSTLTHARALSAAGFLAWRQGDLPEARAQHAKSMALFRALDDRQGIADSLKNHAIMAMSGCDYSAARAHSEESLSIANELGDQRIMATALVNLGLVDRYDNEISTARVRLEEGLSIARELGDRRLMAIAHMNLGTVAFDQKDFPLTKAHYEEVLSIAHELGDRRLLAVAHHNLGGLADGQGDLATAESQYRESQSAFRDLGDRDGIASAAENLGRVASRQGLHAGARVHYKSAVLAFRDLGDTRGVAASLGCLGTLAARLGRSSRAARILGTSDRYWTEVGGEPESRDKREFEETITLTKEALGATAFSVEWARGREMSIDEAIEYALDDRDDA